MFKLGLCDLQLLALGYVGVFELFQVKVKIMWITKWREVQKIVEETLLRGPFAKTKISKPLSFENNEAQYLHLYILKQFLCTCY